MAISTNDQKAIDLVLDSKKESEDFYKEKFDKFTKFDKMYIDGAKKKNTPFGRANLKLPYIFQQIEPFVSQLTEATVAEKPFIAYTGRNLDDEPNAERITAFTQYQLDTGGFVFEINKWFRNLGKYGTAVFKVVWEEEFIPVETTETEQQPVFDDDGNPLVDEFGNVQLEDVEVTAIDQVTVHDGPTFHNLSIYDFFIPRGAVSPNIQKMPWVIHRSYREVDDILLNPNYARAHEEIKKFIAEGNSQDSGTRKPKKRRGVQDKAQESSGKHAGKVIVLEYWGNYHFENEKENEEGEAATSAPEAALLTVAEIRGQHFLLRKEPNPLKYKFKPFLMANDYPIDGEAYGYGELDHIEGLVEEGTALRNARLDVANLSINRIWIVLRTAGINVRNLFSSPNKVILTNDMSGIRPLDMQGITTASIQEIARIDFDIQNTTELLNPRQDVSGVGGAFSNTATGVGFLSSRQNLRATSKLRLLEETFFKPLALMLNWYNRDLVSGEQAFKVLEESENPYQTIDEETLLTEVDYRPASNPQKLSLAERKQNIDYLLQVIAQIEGVRPGVTNFDELLKEVYKISGFAHPEKYINQLPTRVIQTEDGQVVDERGNPVEVVTPDQLGGGNV